jgi:hypothetical protein
MPSFKVCSGVGCQGPDYGTPRSCRANGTVTWSTCAAVRGTASRISNALLRAGDRYFCMQCPKTGLPPVGLFSRRTYASEGYLRSGAAMSLPYSAPDCAMPYGDVGVA